MILVTGGSGLVGQHLIEALTLSGEKVRATYFHHEPMLFTQPNRSLLEWTKCDLLDMADLEEAFADITHVYHCAAMVSYDPTLKDEMKRVNVEGTANIVNFCLDANIQKLCHVSSISTMGKTPADALSNEKVAWEEDEFTTNYAKSKRAAEMEVWRGMAEGLKVVMVNPGIILGEGDDTKSSTNLFKIVYDEFAYFTKGVTAWVDVKDVVKAMIELMNHPVCNERFILSAGNFAFRDIFGMMANAMNKKPPYKLASPWMTELVWRWHYLVSKINGRVATITKETAQSAHRIQHFDQGKLFSFLPEFKYAPIEQSIQRISSNYLKSKISTKQS